MARPKDSNGIPMKAAHFRLNCIPFHEAGLYAMDKDPRTPCLSMKKKLMLIDRAIDHVMDGDKPPKWIWNPDPDRPKERFLAELWKQVVIACEGVKRRGGHG